MGADLDIEVPKKPGNGRRFKQVPVRYLLPNLITLLALCSGVTAIRLGIEGRYELAVGAVIISIVLDAIDGRLARFLKGTSRFGAELDSLADFVNFGVAPAILIYLWSLNDLRTKGWVSHLSWPCVALSGWRASMLPWTIRKSPLGQRAFLAAHRLQLEQGWHFSPCISVSSASWTMVTFIP